MIPEHRHVAGGCSEVPGQQGHLTSREQRVVQSNGMSKGNRLLHVLLGGLQCLLGEAQKPEGARQDTPSRDPRLELEANDIRAGIGRGVSFEHALEKTPRLRLVPEIVQHCSHHSVADGQIGSVPFAAGKAHEIFRSRQAKKIYWALVEGVPKPAQGRISMFLAKGEGMGEARGAGPGRADLERMRVASHGDKDAQHSLTLYAVVDKVAPRLAWLSMRPVTGRTHQLRAHCEAIGHPIIGDPKYNRKAPNDPARSDPLRAVPPGLEPMLHLLARRLILPHPRGGLIDVTAPLPAHMKKSFAMFGFDESERDPIEDAPDE